MKKKETISSLKKKADKVFSLWIRNRDKRCATCGSTKQLQAGHYVSRSINILRYDERNVNAQCVGCNIFKRGAMDIYALYLQNRYGADILKELNQLKQQLHQFTRQELESVISKYQLT